MKKYNWLINLKRLFVIYCKYNKVLIVFWGLCILAEGILPAITVRMNKYLIDAITLLTLKQDYHLNIVIIYLIVIVFIVILGEVCNSIKSYTYTKMTINVKFDLEKKLNEKLINLKYDNFEESKVYNDIILAQQAIESDGLSVMDSVSRIVSDIITIISVLIVLINTHWILPVSIGVSTIPAILIALLIKRYRYDMYVSLIERKRKNGYLSSLFFTKNSAKESKLFDFSPYVMSKWSKEYKDINKKEVNLLVKEKVFTIIGIIIIQVAVAVAAFILVKLIAQDSITLGDYVSLLSATTVLQNSIMGIGGNASEIYETNLYLIALFSILDKDDERINNTINSDEFHEINSIKIKNVCYAYPQGKKRVLNGITLEINKGDRIGIVGYNGSGKSTLVNVLTGLLENYEGDIFINKILLTEKNVASYRRNISYAMQDYVKYELSIRENVSFGNIGMINNDKDLSALLKEVQLDDSLSTKLDQVLSTRFEGGITVSGGEWQKIAICRALLKEADLFFFDEPTAALDPNAEVEVYNRVIDNVVGKTCVIISHRLGAVRHCNKILVMNKGEIVEIGGHDELIEAKGLYYTFFTEQRKMYE